VKDDLEQEVAELFLHLIGRPLIEGIHDLIAFFDQEWFERCGGLLMVPGAAVRAAEFRHKFDESLKIVIHEKPSNLMKL
jgi:hypothetical protein